MKIRTLKVPLLAILACLLWSTASTVIKIGLRSSQPLFFAGFRFIIAGLMLVPFSRNLGDYPRLLRNHWKTVLLVSLFQTIILYALFFYGMTLIPGAIGSIVIGSSPLVAAVMSHFFSHNDKLTGLKILKILSGIFGVILIVISRNPLSLEGFREMLGILLIFTSSLASAAGNIVVAGQKQKLNPIALNSLQIGIGGFVLVALSLPFEGIPVFNFSAEFLIALLWLAFVSAAAFSIWFYLLSQPRVTVSSLNVWKFVIPVFGAILSWLLLPGESPTFFTLLGMLIVSFSVVLYYLPSRKTPPGPTPTVVS